MQTIKSLVDHYLEMVGATDPNSAEYKIARQSYLAGIVGSAVLMETYISNGAGGRTGALSYVRGIENEAVKLNDK